MNTASGCLKKSHLHLTFHFPKLSTLWFTFSYQLAAPFLGGMIEKTMRRGRKQTCKCPRPQGRQLGARGHRGNRWRLRSAERWMIWICRELRFVKWLRQALCQNEAEWNRDNPLKEWPIQQGNNQMLPVHDISVWHKIQIRTEVQQGQQQQVRGEKRF